MAKNFNYTGTMIRLGNSKNYPKQVELRKTEKLWIARDGRRYSREDGSTVYNPYTPVKLDLGSIEKIKCYMGKPFALSILYNTKEIMS